MDIRMPGIDGVTTAGRIRKECTATNLHVIVLATFDVEMLVLVPMARRAAAKGFSSKTILPPELVGVTAEMVAGGGAMSAAATAALTAHLTEGPPPRSTRVARAIPGVDSTRAESTTTRSRRTGRCLR
jgi:DNA-binding NarL/FixJ family response regulator